MEKQGVSSERLRAEGVFRKGYGIVPKYVMHDPDLTLESKAIYAYLCALCGGGERTFPYRDTILRQLRLAKNTYYRHYNPLVEQGYIAVERPQNRDGANIYTLCQNPKKLPDIRPEGEGTLRYQGLKAHGYGVLPRAVMQDPTLTVKAKGLYAYFCAYCGAGDCAFPRKDHILHHLGLSEPTYYKALNLLKERDYLRVVQRKEEGRFGVNDYYLVEHPGREETGGENEKSTPPRKSPPLPKIDDSIAPFGASPVPKNEDTVVPSAPNQRNCDSVVAPPPDPKNEDTIPPSLPTNCDTTSPDKRIGDTKTEDVFINTSPSTNSSSTTSPSTGGDPLASLALRLIGDDNESGEVLRGFLPRFRESIAGKEVRNLPAYLTAAYRNYLREREMPQPIPAANPGTSYDLSELERLIDGGF